VSGSREHRKVGLVIDKPFAHVRVQLDHSPEVEQLRSQRDAAAACLDTALKVVQVELVRRAVRS
jgi:hypothetical protein